MQARACALWGGRAHRAALHLLDTRGRRFTLTLKEWKKSEGAAPGPEVNVSEPQDGPGPDFWRLPLPKSKPWSNI